ncbi:MAG: hypothetical protein MUW56_20390 [Chryseobacterium sp.]|uniref:hypothetical protein n=1 Tax=Chryseobacterium sp. TaxID=1871047 RepID=UPI0025BCC2EB|nr:hypothetical protein [Chryseobacterium sp.]MCJ7935918.1 hypothetical protein [Chryseobacterium sp.]
MKVIVYHINQEDKELLALANRKKHKITIIVYPLNNLTVHFAASKDTVIIIDQEEPLSSDLIQKLVFLGIKNIIFRSQENLPPDLSVIKDSGLKYIALTMTDSKLASSRMIEILDVWEKSD